MTFRTLTWPKTSNFWANFYFNLLWSEIALNHVLFWHNLLKNSSIFYIYICIPRSSCISRFSFPCGAALDQTFHTFTFTKPLIYSWTKLFNQTSKGFTFFFLIARCNASEKHGALASVTSEATEIYLNSFICCMEKSSTVESFPTIRPSTCTASIVDNIWFFFVNICLYNSSHRDG